MGLVLAVAAWLRFYQLGSLSLWLDEGATVLFARAPWATVLGLHGPYDNHPPLYYAMAKLASLVLPEAIAGRYVSALAGVLTVLVVYFIVAALINRIAGVAAAALLAVAPLHVWYSREARFYALTMLLVAVSYYLLLRVVASGAWRWALLYGIVTALAVYSEYTAAFALLPQTALVIATFWSNRKTALRLTAGAAFSVALYLPWIPAIGATAERTAGQATPYLAVTPDRVLTSIRSVVAISGDRSFYYDSNGHLGSVWEAYPQLRAVFLLTLLLAAGLGGWALWHRGARPMLVTGGLLVGTIALAVVVSQRVPAYAERTIIYATLGWVVLVASAFGLRAGAARAVGAVTFLTVFGWSCVSLQGMLVNADKPHWAALAADARGARYLGFPVVAEPAPWGSTIIGIYAGPIASDTEKLSGFHGGGWLAYQSGLDADHAMAALASRGLVRIVHRVYWYPLNLDLYVPPETTLGVLRDVSPGFAGPAGAVPRWVLPTSASLVGDQRRMLVLTDVGPGDVWAFMLIRAAAYGLYTLAYDTEASPSAARSKAYLICVNQRAHWDVAPVDPQLTDVPSDGNWHRVTIATLCPADTVSLRIDLRVSGPGEAAFRNVDLYVDDPPTANKPTR